MQAALESGDDKEVKEAGAALKAVESDLVRSRRLRDKIVACGDRVRSLTQELGRIGQQIASSLARTRARALLRKASRIAGEATRNADEAERLMEILKKRWLALPEDPSSLSS